MKNGSFMTTDPEKQKEWAVLAETFLQYGKKDPASMEIPAFRALYLDEMLRTGMGLALRRIGSTKSCSLIWIQQKRQMMRSRNP